MFYPSASLLQQYFKNVLAFDNRLCSCRGKTQLEFKKKSRGKLKGVKILRNKFCQGPKHTFHDLFHNKSTNL